MKRETGIAGSGQASCGSQMTCTLSPSFFLSLSLSLSSVHLSAIDRGDGSMDDDELHSVFAARRARAQGEGEEDDSSWLDVDQPVAPQLRSITHDNQSEVSASLHTWALRSRCAMADAQGAPRLNSLQNQTKCGAEPSDKKGNVDSCPVIHCQQCWFVCM